MNAFDVSIKIPSLCTELSDCVHDQLNVNMEAALYVGDPIQNLNNSLGSQLSDQLLFKKG